MNCDGCLYRAELPGDEHRASAFPVCAADTEKVVTAPAGAGLREARAAEGRMCARLWSGVRRSDEREESGRRRDRAPRATTLGADGWPRTEPQATGSPCRAPHRARARRPRAVGIAFGAELQSAAGGVLTHVSNALGGLGALVPGADEFPHLHSHRLDPDDLTRALPAAGGRTRRPGVTLSLEDLRSMPRTQARAHFQCVTGWRVPHVHWEGVRLSVVLAAPASAAVRPPCGCSPVTASTPRASPSPRHGCPTSSSPTR